MSTTAEKLQKIIDIKNDLKEKINAKGGSITDTTPFAEYPTIADELMGSSGGEGSTDMLQARVDATNSCKYLFYQYTGDNVDYISKLDTSKVTNTCSMFQECVNLTRVPQFDTGNATDTTTTFYRCAKLETIPQLDMHKVITSASMFSGCEKIITIPELNTINNMDTSGMFYGCHSLETIKKIDLISTKGSGNMFTQCYKLANLNILNIKENIQIASGTSWGHLLTLDSLLNTIKELINIRSSRTLTIGSSNLNKIANVYVKLTGEPEEDESNPKLPFVVCESTDEGAMLITDYVTLKNWVLA